MQLIGKVTDKSDKHWLSHSMCLYQVIMTFQFLNDVVSDIKLTQKLRITSWWRVNQLVNW